MAKNLIKILLLALIALSNIKCKRNKIVSDEKKEDTIIQKDYSLIIAPDLSNRIESTIHPKAINDTVLINTILDNSISFLNIGNRHINQYDAYQMGFINDGILNKENINAGNLRIDLRIFEKKPVDEANYIRTKMPEDIINFKNEVARIYQYSELQTNGADLWNF